MFCGLGLPPATDVAACGRYVENDGITRRAPAAETELNQNPQMRSIPQRYVKQWPQDFLTGDQKDISLRTFGDQAWAL